MANAVVATEFRHPVPSSHGRRDSWRSHIVHQLKLRDTEQREMFRDLIWFYNRLLERTGLTNVRVSSSVRHPSVQSSASSMLVQKQQLKKTTGDLAFQVVQMQRTIRTKDQALDEQRDRLQQQQLQLESVLDSRQQLQRRVELLQQVNLSLKSEYDALLECRRQTESNLQKEKVKEAHRLDDIILPKQRAAAHINSRFERRCRTREARIQKDLQTAAGSKIHVELSSNAPASPGQDVELEHRSLVRSSSARSTRILVSIKELFQKRRGRSINSLDEDIWCPVRRGLARVPAQALHVLEAHEQGINIVQFSSGSDMLATGGTDRVIKLWEVSGGRLTHKQTLEGSTDGITCAEFDTTGWRVLAASYDKSALLWRLDDPAPKLTLTGHSRKVTSARFRSLHQVVTGSADGTVRLWDLHQAACVQVADAASFCSDLLCCDSSFISGHFDGRVRVWDPRMSAAVQQFPALGKVTSLDITSDQRQLLSCCRDDCLQLTDLRMHNKSAACYRADNFSCGSDSTRAVLSPDGSFVTAGSADGDIFVWNVSSGHLETRLRDTHRSSVNAVSWSMSGEFVVSVDKSRQAVLWSGV